MTRNKSAVLGRRRLPYGFFHLRLFLLGLSLDLLLLDLIVLFLQLLHKLVVISQSLQSQLVHKIVLVS